MQAARSSSSQFAAAWPCARCAANLTCALLARAREEEGKNAGGGWGVSWSLLPPKPEMPLKHHRTQAV